MGMRSSRPPPSSAGASRRLARQRGVNTEPEVRLRHELHKRGLRYRLHAAVVPGTRRLVDIAFTRERIAVDVRGCFWHACPEHQTTPQSNTLWWVDKLAANARRDANTESRLEGAGWILVVVWAHDDLTAAADQIQRLISARRQASVPDNASR